MGYKTRKSSSSPTRTATTKSPAQKILRSVLDRSSRVVKPRDIGSGLRVARTRRKGRYEEEDDDEEEVVVEETGGGGEGAEEVVAVKPAPSRPNADPWVKGDSRQIISGIENTERVNLCYINTAFQALGGTSYPEWVNLATHAEYTKDISKKNLATLVDALFGRLNRFTTKKYRSRATVKTPTPEELTFPEFGLQQHCATELITRLNDRLLENMDTKGFENRLAVDILCRMNCLECGNVRTENNQLASLQLEKPTSKTKQATLAQTLEWHRRTNLLPDRGCNRCRGLEIRKIIRRALKNASKDGTSAEDVKALKDRLQLLEQSLQNDTYDNLTEAEEKNLGLARIAPVPKYPSRREEMSDEAYQALRDEYNDTLKKREIHYASNWSETRAITKLPDILLMEFVNVTQVDRRGRPCKLTSRVRFDPSIDLSDYVAGPNRNMDRGGFNLPIRISGDASNPAVPMYELRAVLVHQGPDIGAGHWYCYRREWKDTTNPLGEQWWHCDEDATLRISKQDLFAGTREDPRASRPGNMYALIYEKVAAGETAPGSGGDEKQTTYWKEA
ncbi:hypothetical protein TWF481_001005 [Arthrobotrys musiformis]|uniref:USP domain-containing protein n=1 Tax=Arthrobotrys musiformis TaxID=47236 RepID=A0AAV9WQS1_9PEZI